MKKSILFITMLIVSLCLFSGCGSKSGTLECTRTANMGDYNIDLVYTVEYKGAYATRVKSQEIVKSDNTTLLEQYKTQVESIYQPYKGVEHYSYEVKIDGNTLTSIVDINYAEIDTDKMIEIDSANSQLIKNGKVYKKDIKSVYESIGATCNE